MVKKSLLTKYKANCYDCRKVTSPEHGFLTRRNGGWFAHCFHCYVDKNGIEFVTPVIKAVIDKSKWQEYSDLYLNGVKMLKVRSESV